MKSWGMSLHLDLSECDHGILMDQEALKKFIVDLCRAVDMVPHGQPITDRFGEGKLLGVSAMMFIETSTITVHNDEIDNRAFVDLFSCQDFDPQLAIEFSQKYYKTDKVKFQVMQRG